MKTTKEMKAFLPIICIIFVSFFILLCFNLYNFCKIDFNVFDECYPKVVEVKAYTDEYGMSYGTGTIVSNRFEILTNSHVISYLRGNELNFYEKIEIRLTYENEFRECEIIKHDSERDLTLLKLKDDCDNNKYFFETKEIKYNTLDTVYALGNASNNGISITKGIITMPNFDITFRNIKRNVIQTDVAISNGTSGGPLVNEKGQLLGILTFKLRDNENEVIDSFAYALSINEILEFLAVL